MTEPLPGTDRTELSAGRVTLRRFTRADLDTRCAWPPYDELVFAHLDLKLKTREQRDAWFEREWAARNPFWFAVDDENRQLIGSMTLRDVSRWTRTTRLGMHLHPKRLGQGYGTEVLTLLLDYYFNMLGYRLLKLDVATYNKRAVRCYEKLGFQFKFVFWRANMTGIEWLKDERFAHVRDGVENRRGLERIKHHEMHLDVRTYRKQQQTHPLRDVK
ncbi:MAG TPA: GNAT family N-acetyltransferase [Planctomycetota bacterium]|nr:GNAT family N-acetyltransferase [Planctomycetota bacterium]